MTLGLRHDAGGGSLATASNTAILAQSEDGRGEAPQAEEDSRSLRNRAAESDSPYVRAHASTPVAWQLLDAEAIDRAKRENKLIFLNIGFRACHYCRLTTQDSFSHPAVAEILNSSFIPVIVDREERPDIDTVYMNYIQAVNGAGGWPLNVFLTPELGPVFGGTYWPGPAAEHSPHISDGAVATKSMHGATTSGSTSDLDDDDRLDFLAILRRLKKIWTEQESRCRKEAEEILLRLHEFAAEGTLGSRGVGAPAATGEASAAEPVDSAASQPASALPVNKSGELDLDLDQLEEAYSHLARTFDAVYGGFGLEPKFPTPAKLSFLLRLAQFPTAVRDVVGDEEVEQARDMALHTLRRLRDGGLHDHVGAGFARYSATSDWATPHFEKMVPDNALLLNLYLDAWLSSSKTKQLKGDDEFVDVVFELADYLSSEPIALSSGGFASSEAADSFYRKGDRHMREGAYYLWTRREFDNIVGKDGDGAEAGTVAAAHWNVLQHGNVAREQDPNDEFMNQNVLCVVKDFAELSKQFGMSEQQAKHLVALSRERLRAHRAKERVAPELDDKIVASFNGMVISALARTAAAVQYVDKDRADKYLSSATKAASFLRSSMWDAASGVLYRTQSRREPRTKGFAEDYAFVIDGLLDLYETARDEQWLKWADELQRLQIDLFYDGKAEEGEASRGLAGRPSSGAFYSTTDPDPQVILRLKDGMDTAQPSTNAVCTSNLFRLGALLGDTQYMDLAKESITAFEAEILQYPWLFIGLLTGVVTARLGGQNWLFVGEDADNRKDPVLRQYYTAPSVAQRSVLFVKPAGDTWLESRNPLLKKFIGGKPENGPYLLEHGKYRLGREDKN